LVGSLFAVVRIFKRAGWRTVGWKGSRRNRSAVRQKRRSEIDEPFDRGGTHFCRIRRPTKEGRETDKKIARRVYEAICPRRTMITPTAARVVYVVYRCRKLIVSRGSCSLRISVPVCFSIFLSDSRRPSVLPRLLRASRKYFWPCRLAEYRRHVSYWQIRAAQRQLQKTAATENQVTNEFGPFRTFHVARIIVSTVLYVSIFCVFLRSG